MHNAVAASEIWGYTQCGLEEPAVRCAYIQNCNVTAFTSLSFSYFLSSHMSLCDYEGLAAFGFGFFSGQVGM